MTISDSPPAIRPPDRFVDLSILISPTFPFCSLLPAPTPPHLEYSDRPRTSCRSSLHLHPCCPQRRGTMSSHRPLVRGCLRLVSPLSSPRRPFLANVTDPGIWVQFLYALTGTSQNPPRPDVLEWVWFGRHPFASHSADRSSAKTRRSGTNLGRLRVVWKIERPVPACRPLPLDDMPSRAHPTQPPA